MAIIVIQRWATGNWGVATEKAHFSEVLDKAETEGPQLVKRQQQEFFVRTVEDFAAGRLPQAVSEPAPTRLQEMTRLVTMTIDSSGGVAMGTWGLAEAKAHFSEVVAKAMTEGPQEVSKGGKDAVVIVSKAEWDRKTKKKYANAAEFFLQSPLRGSGLKLERVNLRARKVSL